MKTKVLKKSDSFLGARGVVGGGQGIGEGIFLTKFKFSIENIFSW